jgi:hypothetical protein
MCIARRVFPEIGKEIPYLLSITSEVKIGWCSTKGVPNRNTTYVKIQDEIQRQFFCHANTSDASIAIMVIVICHHHRRRRICHGLKLFYQDYR